MVTEKEIVSRIALMSILGIGPRMFAKLLDAFSSAEAAFEAPFSQFKEVPRFSRRLYKDMHDVDRETIKHDLRKWTKRGVVIYTHEDGHYPGALRAIDDPPPILYSNKTKDFLPKGTIAIVGTRKPSRQSYLFAENLAAHLASMGFTILSGMASGIDRAAHLGALKVEGNTIAVLGSGILVPFPPENKDLYQEIIIKGQLLSEQLPLTSPNAGTLIARNRIIAGMADLTIVVEALRRGGSIETGMKTLKYDKTLLVYDYNNSGNRFLIRQGGIPFREARMVLEHWQFSMDQ